MSSQLIVYNVCCRQTHYENFPFPSRLNTYVVLYVDLIFLQDIANKTLLSDDMRREAEREEWEKEAMEDINGPVHYANLKDEG